MQRLTEKADEYFHKGGIKYYPKDKGLNKSICNKLGEYEDLEEQGLLLRLPCKVGDTVYILFINRIMENRVISIIVQRSFIVVYCANNYYPFSIEDFGKTVFLTKEEAEAKLREMEAGE